MYKESNLKIRDPSSLPLRKSNSELGTVALMCNPSTLEVEVGGVPSTLGQPGLSGAES